MKFIFTICLTLFFALSSFSQALNDDIKKHAQTYQDYLTEQNFDGVLDYLYPKVFEMAPREQMKIGMQQMFNAPDMKIEFISNKVNNVSREKIVDGITYAAVFYASKMRMTFLTEKDESVEDKKAFFDFMKSTMASQFGEENVTSNAETMSLIITTDSSMFAILDPKYKDWKFIANEEAMQSLVNSIIPETVRTELLKRPE